MGSCNDQDEAKAKCVWVHGPIIVGAGPSGLAVAASLSQHRVPSLILERTDSIASLWKYRTYDRLKLHLPKHFCELPLMPFPDHFPKYPSKHQFVSYLESYASRFSIHPRFNQTVLKAQFDPACAFWTVRTQDSEYISRWLIVATGENAEPFIPKLAGMENFHGPIAHTSVYKSGSDYKNQKVLVVGCGNSGMEVSLDLCRHNAIPHMVARNTVSYLSVSVSLCFPLLSFTFKFDEIYINMQVHVLPREIFGISTFGIAMALLKWFPLRIVDKFLLLMANLILGNSDQCGLRRPKTGPLELKNATGKTPVLDVGALSQIKSGKIKVTNQITSSQTKDLSCFFKSNVLEC